MAMDADREIHTTILSFLQEEFDAISSSLMSGKIGTFSERVRLSRRIDAVMSTLEPHTRRDIRARKLVRRCERLKNDLLASRPLLEKRIPPELVSQLFRGRKP